MLVFSGCVVIKSIEHGSLVGKRSGPMQDRERSRLKVNVISRLITADQIFVQLEAGKVVLGVVLRLPLGVVLEETCST